MGKDETAWREGIRHLTQDVHPLLALRSLADRAARDGEFARSPAGEDAFGEALRLIYRYLAQRPRPTPVVPSLLRALDAVASTSTRTCHAAGEIRDLLQERDGPAGDPAHGPGHFLAMLDLVDAGTGLAAPWSWDAEREHYDFALPLLDRKGENQVAAAERVMLGLVEETDLASVEERSQGRRIIPLIALWDQDCVEGNSLGLPTLLAMIAAIYGLEPAVPTAATGTLDRAAIPPRPVGTRVDAAFYLRVLDVGIARVGAIPNKLRAVFDQFPETRLILLPAGNQGDVARDPDLIADIAASGVEVRYVERIGDLFTAPGLYSPPLTVPPLAVAPGYTAAECARALRWARARCLVTAALLVEFLVLGVASVLGSRG